MRRVIDWDILFCDYHHDYLMYLYYTYTYRSTKEALQEVILVRVLWYDSLSHDLIPLEVQWNQF